MPVQISPGRRQAMQAAEELLEELGVEEPPAHQLEELARELGVRVIPKDLEENTSGVLARRDGEAMIGVNESHPDNRQHFTIAHELGHWLLHSEETGVFVDEFTLHYRGDNSTKRFDPRESEANAFAAAFLMPEAMLREDVADRRIDASDDDELADLAKKYGVSLQALTIRLTNLELLAF